MSKSRRCPDCGLPLAGPPGGGDGGYVCEAGHEWAKSGPEWRRIGLRPVPDAEPARRPPRVSVAEWWSGCEDRAARPPAIAGDSRRGMPGGNAGLLLRLKALVRDGLTDEEIAETAQLHPVFDSDMINLARAEVEVDQDMAHGCAEVRLGGPDSPVVA